MPGGGRCLDLGGKSGLLPLVPWHRLGRQEQRFSSRCTGEKHVLGEEGGGEGGGKPGVPIKGHQGAGLIGDTPVT